MTSVKWLTRSRRSPSRSRATSSRPLSLPARHRRGSTASRCPGSRPGADGPAGMPDFFSRQRSSTRGRRPLWAGVVGPAPIERVEVGGGRELGGRDPRCARRPVRLAGWTLRWDAKPGEHVLSCRATDSDGDAQPTSRRGTTRGSATTASSGSRSRWRDRFRVLEVVARIVRRKAALPRDLRRARPGPGARRGAAPYSARRPPDLPDELQSPAPAPPVARDQVPGAPKDSCPE